MNVLYCLMGVLIAAFSQARASSTHPIITGDLAFWCTWDSENDQLSIIPRNSCFFDLEIKSSKTIEININHSKNQDHPKKEIIIKKRCTHLTHDLKEASMWVSPQEHGLIRQHPKILIIDHILTQSPPPGFYSLEDIKIKSTHHSSAFKAHHWSMEPQFFTGCLALKDCTFTLDVNEPSENSQVLSLFSFSNEKFNPNIQKKKRQEEPKQEMPSLISVFEIKSISEKKEEKNLMTCLPSPFKKKPSPLEEIKASE